MKSMTGFGLSQWKTSSTVIEVTVQSYNGKFFEARVQTPPCYLSLEGELRKTLQKKFQRGYVSLLIVRTPAQPVSSSSVSWDSQQAKKWKSLFRQMATSLKMKNDLTLIELSRQPGVLKTNISSVGISASEKTKLKTTLRKAIELCNKERVREGLALKKDFQKNTTALSQSLKKIKIHFTQQNKTINKTVRDKIKLIKLSTNEKDKLQQEMLSALLNRTDIDEEIYRMEEHLKVFRSVLNSPGTIGKKISFYLQEMIREMNTIGSKSQSFKLTKEAVQAKSLIEKMREQAQNVE